MRKYPVTFAFLIVALILAQPAAFAACDTETDDFCCAQDSDCTMYVNPSLCVFVPMNKLAADRHIKENPPRSKECSEESIEKLKRDAKAMKPTCVSYGCDFNSPGE